MSKDIKADSGTSSPNLANDCVGGSGFRIVEMDGKFTIERQFEKSKIKWFLFWIVKETKSKVWKRITNTGGECIYLRFSGMVIDTYKDVLPYFESIEEAEKVVQKFINPPQPVYHYR